MHDVRIPNLRRLEEWGDLDACLNAGPSNFTRWSAKWTHRLLEGDIRTKDGLHSNQSGCDVYRDIYLNVLDDLL